MVRLPQLVPSVDAGGNYVPGGGGGPRVDTGGTYVPGGARAGGARAGGAKNQLQSRSEPTLLRPRAGGGANAAADGRRRRRANATAGGGAVKGKPAKGKLARQGSGKENEGGQLRRACRLETQELSDFDAAEQGLEKQFERRLGDRRLRERRNRKVELAGRVRPKYSMPTFTPTADARGDVMRAHSASEVAREVSRLPRARSTPTCVFGAEPLCGLQLCCRGPLLYLPLKFLSSQRRQFGALSKQLSKRGNFEEASADQTCHRLTFHGAPPPTPPHRGSFHRSWL